ncbi:hypothetical protein [Streptomyces sp. YIM 98790]|uniref:hypothetical protein n=1 Tax=Streptomyces sp. YIM 98790 TaxID=2689077 RepID=UPI00140E5199|nr:hypothetical protein [Streptomyces sp. YIM 98790]
MTMADTDDVDVVIYRRRNTVYADTRTNPQPALLDLLRRAGLESHTSVLYTWRHQLPPDLNPEQEKQQASQAAAELACGGYQVLIDHELLDETVHTATVADLIAQRTRTRRTSRPARHRRRR